eukprot:23183_1
MSQFSRRYQFGKDTTASTPKVVESAPKPLKGLNGEDIFDVNYLGYDSSTRRWFLLQSVFWGFAAILVLRYTLVENSLFEGLVRNGSSPESLTALGMFLFAALSVLVVASCRQRHKKPENLGVLTQRQKTLLGIPETPDDGPHREPIPATEKSPSTPQGRYTDTVLASYEKKARSTFGQSSYNRKSNVHTREMENKYDIIYHPQDMSSDSSFMTNPMQVEEYLARKEKQDPHHEAPNRANLSMMNMSLTGGRLSQTQPQNLIQKGWSLPKYVNCYPDPKESGQVGIEQEHDDLYYKAAALKLYESCQISECVHRWAENMRLWVCASVLKVIVRDFERSDRDLLGIQNGIVNRMRAQNQAPPADLVALRDSKERMTFFTLHRAQLSEFSAAITRRERLNSAFEKLWKSDTEYVLHRIQQLSSSEVLQQFRWDGGGYWKDCEWDKSKPCDSQIIMGAFCVVMDRFFYPRRFSKQHFISHSDRKRAHRSAPAALKKSWSQAAVVALKTAPAYHVVVVKRGPAGADVRPLPTLPGPNNVFHCLALFAYYIKERLDNELDGVNLSERQLGFLEVVD